MIEQRRTAVEEITAEILDLEGRHRRALAKGQEAAGRVREINERRRQLSLSVFEGDALAVQEDEGLRAELEEIERRVLIASAAAGELAGRISPARERLEEAECAAHERRYHELAEERHRLETEVDRAADELAAAIEKVCDLDGTQRAEGRAAELPQFANHTSLPEGFDRTLTRWFARRFPAWVARAEHRSQGPGTYERSELLADVDGLALSPEPDED